MKVLNATLLAVAVLSAAITSTSVFADGGRRHSFKQFHHSKQFHHPKRFGHFKRFHHRHSFKQFHHPKRFGHFKRFHHGHRGTRLEILIGAPLAFVPWWHAPPRYPATVVVPSSPPVYIEQGPATPSAAPSQAYWYYCRESKAYYPYVTECPGGWQQVPPQPPPS